VTAGIAALSMTVFVLSAGIAAIRVEFVINAGVICAITAVIVITAVEVRALYAERTTTTYARVAEGCCVKPAADVSNAVKDATRTARIAEIYREARLLHIHKTMVRPVYP